MTTIDTGTIGALTYGRYARVDPVWGDPDGVRVEFVIDDGMAGLWYGFRVMTRDAAGREEARYFGDTIEARRAADIFARAEIARLA